MTAGLQCSSHIVGTVGFDLLIERLLELQDASARRTVRTSSDHTRTKRIKAVSNLILIIHEVRIYREY